MTARRVVIIDDSSTMRALIRMALEAHPGLEVVGEAEDPLQARVLIRDLEPDVVTLDVEMPNMNGLEFLERLMRLRPTPVVMVSSLTQRGADVSLAALELGAVECVAKPSRPDPAAFSELAQLVFEASSARVRPIEKTPASPPVTEQRFGPNDRIVAIGASTGGVEALMTVLGGFPAQCPATVITQHMPPKFTASFAERLDRVCAPRVTEAQNGQPLEPGHVYLAPGGLTHLMVRRLGGRLTTRLVEGDLLSGHRPSVDALFHSVAQATGSNAVGVILTGMGRDGAEGLLAMRRAGAATIGQDEASCIVYGMPRVAEEIGAVERQLPLSRIATNILAVASRSFQGAA